MRPSPTAVIPLNKMAAKRPQDLRPVFCSALDKLRTSDDKRLVLRQRRSSYVCLHTGTGFESIFLFELEI